MPFAFSFGFIAGVAFCFTLAWWEIEGRDGWLRRRCRVLRTHRWRMGALPVGQETPDWHECADCGRRERVRTGEVVRP